MIEGALYIERVSNYFEFLILEFDFDLVNKEIRGNTFYDVQYRNMAKVISISYENIEDYLLVNIFLLQNGELPNYDDSTKTINLNRISAFIIPKINNSEFNANNEFFSNCLAENTLERKLLKLAKTLRLCLIHLSEWPLY
ncbi:hypothetical protein IC229_07620 [Spirosoma sp. BT702]|uniref:Uncharacterized protein n=1 Tax=Spirosoma profusum TaxID=2771354 RepID=A0A927AQH5_9BACT|nr:hypothetical protein [Spirosoma profusum]MBD2700498.1 hypothetical protein [Spirosoma profusum]